MVSTSVVIFFFFFSIGSGCHSLCFKFIFIIRAKFGEFWNFQPKQNFHSKEQGRKILPIVCFLRSRTAVGSIFGAAVLIGSVRASVLPKNFPCTQFLKILNLLKNSTVTNLHQAALCCSKSCVYNHCSKSSVRNDTLSVHNERAHS